MRQTLPLQRLVQQNRIVGAQRVGRWHVVALAKLREAFGDWIETEAGRCYYQGLETSIGTEQARANRLPSARPRMLSDVQAQSAKDRRHKTGKKTAASPIFDLWNFAM